MRFLPIVQRALFGAIALVALMFSLLAGVFITADAISEERREGTLGLLFLTKLRGYDVLLGKLGGNSIHALFGVVGVLPLLALRVLLGGVTGGEVVRIGIVLVTALMFSLSAGLFVSVLSRDSRVAFAGAFVLILMAKRRIAGYRPGEPLQPWLEPAARSWPDTRSCPSDRSMTEEFRNSPLVRLLVLPPRPGAPGVRLLS